MARHKTSYEDVKKYFESFGYELLSKEYINSNQKLLIKCPNSNHEPYKTSFNSFKNHNRRCRKCYEEERKRKESNTYDDTKKIVEDEGYELLSSKEDITDKDGYVLMKTYIEVKCPIENHKPHKIKFNDFKNNNVRCKECRHDNQRFSYEYVKNYIESFGQTLLSTEYINGKQKLLVKCPNPNHPPYEVTFENFKGSKSKRGTRCPYCKESIGEREVSILLNKLNIEYEREYRFEDCKVRRGLPFDFYLPKYNCCIEFDGEGHYLYKCFGRDLLNLMNIKYRDDIKTNYCNDNNIKLIRIPYWDINNIEEIIVNKLELE